MVMQRIITNNPLVRDMAAVCPGHKITFMNTEVQEVLRVCEALLVQGKFRLYATPMGGRRARPFPYLTMVLEGTKEGAPAEDFKILSDYKTLDKSRKDRYKECDDNLREDFRILDCALTRAAIMR